MKKQRTTKAKPEQSERQSRSFLFHRATLQRLKVICATRGGTAQDIVEGFVEQFVKDNSATLPKELKATKEHLTAKR